MKINRYKRVLSNYPSRHEALTECWFYVGPLSMTLAQHWVNNLCLLGTLTTFEYLCYGSMTIRNILILSVRENGPRTERVTAKIDLY